jgi:hypothetical protein
MKTTGCVPIYVPGLFWSSCMNRHPKHLATFAETRSLVTSRALKMPDHVQDDYIIKRNTRKQRK